MWKTTIPITILKVDISYKETSIKLEIESPSKEDKEWIKKICQEFKEKSNLEKEEEK